MKSIAISRTLQQHIANTQTVKREGKKRKEERRKEQEKQKKRIKSGIDNEAEGEGEEIASIKVMQLQRVNGLGRVV
jgi:hypothetical protein